MTRTIISSDKQEIVIGFDSPFCVIGERINPTGRKLLAAEMAAGDYSRVISDAIAQVEAGATMLDVNAGIPMADDASVFFPRVIDSNTLRLSNMQGPQLDSTLAYQGMIRMAHMSTKHHHRQK